MSEVRNLKTVAIAINSNVPNNRADAGGVEVAEVAIGLLLRSRSSDPLHHRSSNPSREATAIAVAADVDSENAVAVLMGEGILLRNRPNVSVVYETNRDHRHPEPQRRRRISKCVA